MAVQPCREYEPVSADQMVFQFVRSVSSAGGSVKDVSCGSARPDNKFADPVVGDCRRPLARFCNAVGRELMNWAISVPMFEVPAWAAAADCCSVPAGLVVCGGSANGVSTEALPA